MKKILLISASPEKGGYCDNILNAVQKGTDPTEAEITTVRLRHVPISPCLACNCCANDGVCVQDDGMRDIISFMHDSDAIVFAVPVYYNYMAAQAVTLLDRLYCTYRYRGYKPGPKKKICVFLTCEGSDKKTLINQIDGIMALGSIARSVSEYKVEVYRGCEDDFNVFLQRARGVGEWAVK